MSVHVKRFTLPFALLAVLTSVAMLLLSGLAPANANSAETIPERQTADTLEIVSSDLANQHIDPALTSGLARGERAVFIVVLEDESLALYRGGIDGYPGTSRDATGDEQLDPRSAESQDYLAYLDDQREKAIQDADAEIGRNLEVVYEYGATLVGFASEMTQAEANRIAALPNVKFVEQEQISYPQTDAGPQWQGASQIWGGDWNALTYEAAISGANETTPVTTTVSGEGAFTYNFYTNELAWEITLQNPDNVNLTAMHIHSAPAGTNGAVIHNLGLAATTGGVSESGTVTLTDAQQADLVNGNLYINVHSSDNPSGEARGQIGLVGSLGEGIVVGIIDTGIDPWNPSFLATGGDGYVHTNPLGEGNYVGVCDPANAGGSGVVAYDATFPCNSKLIGVWGYSASDESPRDTDGHGSHTAGTSAGNIVFDAVAIAPTEVYTADISGVAPHANIIAYDGCSDDGGCPGASLSAARDQALLDGVDVINYSIGSSAPTADLWSGAEALQWLALRDAGVFVATSNGNAGNEPATTGSPSDLPWITSVGASSHNRAFLATFMMTDEDGNSITVQGQALTTGYGPAEVIFSTRDGDTESNRFCPSGAFAPDTFSGEIVICERGSLSDGTTVGRVEKGQAALDGGAGGFVLAQPIEATGGPGSVTADTHVLPAIHIDYYQYQILRQFMLTDAVGTVMGTLSGGAEDIDDAHGDIMATFSSRGPSRADADLIVPNVTAPGRAIWAAYHQGEGGDGDYSYNVIQGTSMSSPHVAGAGALLSAMRPDWTPAQIESALMMTARDTVLDDDGTTTATPFAQGAGHIQVDQAAMSPLVMDVTNAQYMAADPDVDNGFFVRDLNIASFGEDACVGTCSWTRTVENVSTETLTWNLTFDLPMSITAMVNPASFTLAPGETQELAIEINVLDATIDGEWRFGSLRMDETSDAYPDAHLPFAVLPSSGNIPETLEIETQNTSGTVDMKNLVSIDIADLHTEVIGLYKADRHEFTIVQDNDTGASFPAIFFDDPATTEFVSIDVPADSFSVIADIVETASPDLDLLLFLDADGDGPELSDVGDPAANPNACQSASGGSAETCEILSPAPGTYYAAIINFSQVTAGGDPVDLATVVVPNNGSDEGNMTVTGPATVSGQEPYTMTVAYDDASMTAIDKLYGYFTVGSSPAAPGDIATVRVYLEYLGIPDIEIDPSAFAATVAPEANLEQVMTLEAIDGVLDWTMITPNGTESVQDGSFEEGLSDNPYWRADASIGSGILPICSPSTCGPNFATDGDWYLWLGGAAGIQAFAEQDVTIAEGDQANLTFRMGMGAVVTATMTLTVSLDGMPIAVYTEADMASFGTFPSVSIDVSTFADGESHLLRFDFENSPGFNFNVFIDEVSLISVSAESLTCNVIGDIPWLSASPAEGVLSPGTTDVTLTFDAAGLGTGVYFDTLCLNSNDPDEPVLNIPVTMRVAGDPPEISLDTVAISETVIPFAQSTVTVSLSNTGGGPLDWALAEVDGASTRAAAFVDEGFEGTFPPADWTIVDGATTEISWLQSTTAHSGAASAALFYPGNANPIDSWLISPAFDTGSEEGLLNFFSRGSAFWCRDDFNNCDFDIWIVVGATAGDADDINLGKVEDAWTAEHTWTEHNIVIPADLGSIRIGIHGTAADGDSMRIDDFRVIENSSICNTPSDIPWLSASPTSGRLDAGLSQEIVLSLDARGLANGTHEGIVCLIGNDPVNSPVEVPVTLTVDGFVQFMPFIAHSEPDIPLDYPTR